MCFPWCLDSSLQTNTVRGTPPPAAKNMDPMYIGLSYYRRRKFDECIEICSKLLAKNPYDQSAWALKTRALTGMYELCGIIERTDYFCGGCFELFGSLPE